MKTGATLPVDTSRLTIESTWPRWLVTATARMAGLAMACDKRDSSAP